MEKTKRYIVKVEMYVQAKNDYMARRAAHKIAGKIKDGYEVDVVEIGEQPFASFNYRPLENISKPSKLESND